MHLVPPILVTMSFHPAFDKYNMTSLRLLSSGAAPLGDGLVKKVLAKFAERGNTRLKLTQRHVPFLPFAVIQLDGKLFPAAYE
jgi:4-coumarate--CoA ligase